jgi:hypothetical protein
MVSIISITTVPLKKTYIAVGGILPALGFLKNSYSKLISVITDMSTT